MQSSLPSQLRYSWLSIMKGIWPAKILLQLFSNVLMKILVDQPDVLITENMPIINNMTASQSSLLHETKQKIYFKKN